MMSSNNLSGGGDLPQRYDETVNASKLSDMFLPNYNCTYKKASQNYQVTLSLASLLIFGVPLSPLVLSHLRTRVMAKICGIA